MLVAVVVLGGGGFWWWKSHQTPAPTAGTGGPGGGKDRVTPVVSATARAGDLPIYFDGLGTVTAFNTVAVRSRVDGQVNDVKFVEGQIVKEGDLLAEIDPRPFQVQLTQAQGQLARDQALLTNAKLDLERYQKAQDAIPKQQIDTQQALVSQYEAATKIDQGQVDSAELNLTYSKITAPFTGRIGLRQVDKGNIVHANDASGIAVITQIQPIAVTFTLPQDQIPQVMERVSQGEPPQVEALDRDRRTSLAKGTLLAVDNQVDPNSGTIRLKAKFANEDGKLFPNQFVNARLHIATRTGVTLIPLAAIQRGPEGKTYVYVVKADETVEVRDVKSGQSEAEKVIITEGLKPGEIVVVDGVDKLTPGAKVSARSARGTTKPSTTGPSTQPGASQPGGGNRRGSRAKPDGTATDHSPSAHAAAADSNTSPADGATSRPADTGRPGKPDAGQEHP